MIYREVIELGDYDEPANSSGAFGMIVRNETDGICLGAPLDLLDHPDIKYGGMLSTMEGMLMTFERDKTIAGLDVTESLSQITKEAYIEICLCVYVAMINMAMIF